MEFFLDMHNARPHAFPNWFLFSDDDYYMRLEYLDALVSNPRTPSTGAFALQPWGWKKRRKPAGEGRDWVFRPNYGLFAAPCKVPCAHRVDWMGWGGFSIGALRYLEDSIRRNELVHVCESWGERGITHDVGLATFTWMHGLTLIHVPFCTEHEFDSAVYHKPKKPYDLKFSDLWANITAEPNASFDIVKYRDAESQSGRLASERVSPTTDVYVIPPFV
jgi:hypothetical protein